MTTPDAGAASLSLADLEHALQAYVLHGAVRVGEWVDPGPRANPAQRLRIYYDAYRLRLIDALGTDYEALRAAIGDEQFRAACLAYVEAVPSSFRNVRWYGGGLAEFLRDSAPWSERPWLADLARFEWSLTLAFDAQDSPSLSFEDLARVPPQAWTGLAFRLHPCVQLLALGSNAPALRKALDAGEALPEVETYDPPVDWVIWRNDSASFFRCLSVPERLALGAARRGESFSAICEAVCEQVPPEEAPGAVAAWLRTWVDDGLIAGVTLPDAGGD